MNGAELEALLTGLLRHWQVRAEMRGTRTDEGVAALLTFDARPSVTVSWQQAPFGIVWRVEPEGRRVRTYPSVNGMIRDLRERLVPERGSARVLFAGKAGDAP